MSDFGTELARLMAERGTGVRQLARAVYRNPGHISNLRSGKARPSAELAAELDAHLGAGGALAALAPAATAGALPGDDEIAALELARRAGASDVGDGTCERLELAFDDLATAYPRTAPGDLLRRVRSHLGYATQLLDGRATLAQRRRLLACGGWLSLLAATCLIDLDRDAPALAYLRTAAQLASETGHAEIAAWTLETRAWMELTAGGYREAAALARDAQQAAPAGGSAAIQAAGQEGRALARLGDRDGTRAALARVEAAASALPAPGRPEHHYRYDPGKAEAYAVTALSWIGDPAAERLARDVLARLESPGQGPPRRRRAASARLDLALALAGSARHDEAAGAALAAVTSGCLVPSNYWRAREVITAVSARGVPGARDLADAYRAELEARPGALAPPRIPAGRGAGRLGLRARVPTRCAPASPRPAGALATWSGSFFRSGSLPLILLRKAVDGTAASAQVDGAHVRPGLSGGGAAGVHDLVDARRHLNRKVAPPGTSLVSAGHPGSDHGVLSGGQRHQSGALVRCSSWGLARPRVVGPTRRHGTRCP